MTLLHSDSIERFAVSFSLFHIYKIPKFNIRITDVVTMMNVKDVVQEIFSTLLCSRLLFIQNDNNWVNNLNNL